MESGLPPEGFIDKMRHDGALIPGIGHRIKSILSPDKRVSILKKFALENFPIHNYLNYALEVCFHFLFQLILKVEKCTLQKANNLILNVVRFPSLLVLTKWQDGIIGVLFLDMMDSSPAFSKAEMKDIVELGYVTRNV